MAQLWAAIGRGNVDLAAELVKSGINLHERLYLHPEIPSFLHAVISWLGNEKLALLMLEHGADANACDARGYSVLHAAIACNCSIAFVRELLVRGAKVDVASALGCDILMTAACQPTAAELLPILVEADLVDEETRNRRGILALYYLVASDRENLAAMEAVLALGLPIDRLCDKGYTLLHHAVLAEKADTVRLLLRYGADVNAKSIDNIHPLFAALNKERSTTAKILIENGASIHDSFDNGLFPIHAACQAESYENVELLLRLGVDVSVVNRRGWTAFSMLRFVARSFPCVLLFIKHLALLNARGIPIHASDLDLIRTSGLQTVFEECARELQTAKQVKIYNNISFFCVLTKSVRELSLIVNNPDFVKKYESNLREILFPAYHECIQLRYKIAEKRRNLIFSNLKVLETLFGGLLPSLVLEKVVYNLCHDQLVILEKNYILSLH